MLAAVSFHLRRLPLGCLALVLMFTGAQTGAAGQLMAGAARVDISAPGTGTPDDRLWVKALVLQDDDTTTVLITVDAVALAEIGYIKNDYIPTVRAELERELKIKPSQVLFNASHCHGVVAPDVAQRTVQAVREAWSKRVPVKAGVGAGKEDRVSENRRIKLKSGRTADVRHAYSLPADEEVAEVGPIDPEIGILRLDRLDGKPLALVYNFAVHPIMGVPSGGSTADLTGFASSVIEENLGDGAIALFVQGCAGDLNPVRYKEVNEPRDAETLGNMLGLSTLKAARKIRTREDAPLDLIAETLTLPRADFGERIAALEAEQKKMLGALQGTSLNLRTFLPLAVKYSLTPEFPSSFPQRYLHEKKLGKEDLRKMDANNRESMQAYVRNIYVMEELTRLQANLELLRMHQKQNAAAGKKTLEVEVCGLRVGDFRLVTFPGEVTVEIGRGIKKRSPHKSTYVAGYTNGYIYYSATAEQLRNPGHAQEDCDTLLAPGWQKLFEDRVAEILKRL